MPNYNNPAARLHAIFSRFAGIQPSGQAVQTVWATVLGVENAEVPTELCRLAGLVPQIIEIVRLGDDEHQIENVTYWAPHWAGVLTGYSLSGSNASDFIKSDLLRNLGVTASYLSYVAAEGVVPDAEQTAELREQVAALLDEARGADKLPLDLRTVLVHRLHDIVYALDHIQVLGPDGVQAAVERLVCAIDIRGASGESDEADGLITRIQRTARHVYAVFLFGPTAYEAIGDWRDIGQLMLGR